MNEMNVPVTRENKYEDCGTRPSSDREMNDREMNDRE
jgi:hypothetical protein